MKVQLKFYNFGNGDTCWRIVGQHISTRAKDVVGVKLDFHERCRNALLGKVDEFSFPAGRGCAHGRDATRTRVRVSRSMVWLVSSRKGNDKFRSDRVCSINCFLTGLEKKSLATFARWRRSRIHEHTYTRIHTYTHTLAYRFTHETSKRCTYRMIIIERLTPCRTILSRTRLKLLKWKLQK